MQTVKESFETLEHWFHPERAAGIKLTVEYRIEGEGGGVWHAVVADSTCKVGEGPPIVEPDLIVSAKAEDWLDSVSGNALFPDLRLISMRTGTFPGIGPLGLLGKDYPAPEWARRHWFRDDLSMLAYFAPHGELDHAAFSQSIKEGCYVAVSLNGFLGCKTLSAAIKCKRYRARCWRVGGLVLVSWVALALAGACVPLILFVHWLNFLLAAGLSIVWWWEFKRFAMRMLRKWALDDEEFWRYAMEEGLLTVVSLAP